MAWNDEREREAARWCAKAMSGEIAPKEQRAFDAWRENQDNVAALQATERAIASADLAATEILAVHFEAELSEAFARSRAAWRAPLAAAASLVVVAAAAAIFMAFPARHIDPQEVYATSPDEVERFVLADGSALTLNSDSRATGAFSPADRKIELQQGEALFDVVRDPARPFVVTTAMGQIAVIGTVFRVQVDDDETMVSVVEGRVDVRPTGGEALGLAANEQAAMRPDGAALRVAFDANAITSWSAQRVQFRRARLEDVVEELNRHYARRIVLSDASASELLVTGEFDLSDQRSAVRSLELALGLAATWTDTEVLITRQGEE